MSVSIYLNNLQVQIVNGTFGKKGKFQNSIIADAPDGSIINGIVMDQDSFVQFLNRVWAEYNLSKKDVHLVVNSNKIPGRLIDVPALNVNKTRQFISRELADMQRDDEESVICYSEVSGTGKGGKMRKLYAEIVGNSLVKDYIDIFSAAGITLKSIVSAEGSIIGLLDQTVAKQYKTFVLQIINGNIVSNILWVDGVFNYFNSTRLFNDIGSDAYYTDCARSLSNLSQFMVAHKIEHEIERVVIAGTPKSDISFYGQYVDQQGINAPVELLYQGLGDTPQQNFEAQQAIFAVSGLFDVGKEGNFIARYNSKASDKKIDPQLLKGIIIVGASLGAMVLIFLISLFMRLSRQKVYDDLIEYNEDPNIVAQVNLFDAMSLRRDALAAQSNSISNVLATIETYPILNDDVIQKLKDTAKGYAEIEIGSFDAENGLVNVTAKADDVELINQYIDRLEEQDMFSSVRYSGYNMTQDGTWSINVVCTFAAGVGREGEQHED